MMQNMPSLWLFFQALIFLNLRFCRNQKFCNNGF